MRFSLLIFRLANIPLAVALTTLPFILTFRLSHVNDTVHILWTPRISAFLPPHHEEMRGLPQKYGVTSDEVGSVRWTVTVIMPPFFSGTGRRDSRGFVKTT